MENQNRNMRKCCYRLNGRTYYPILYQMRGSPDSVSTETHEHTTTNMST